MVQKYPQGTHQYNKKIDNGMGYYDMESHHMPTKSTYKKTGLTEGRGIAIPMDKEDHKLTASHPQQEGYLKHIADQKTL